jgi:uncharacterized protein (DUF488 family)
MNLYTIGFTKKTAAQFFELLIRNNVKRLIDIRLNNKSQLAGFAKGEDLSYLLPKIGNIEYVYKPEYAPTKELLDRYRDKQIDWIGYDREYIQILKERDILKNIDWALFDGACLLCSEETADACHRRLLAEYLAAANRDIVIKHLER